jgi:hypothetical protein
LETDTDAEPLIPPQVVAVAAGVSDIGVDPATDTLVVAVQPLLVTVTVYVPDDRPVIWAVLPLLLQE